MAPLTPVMSKVEKGPLDSYPQKESMGVFAYLSELEDGQSWPADASVSSYFENKEFAYKAEAQAWAGVTAAYWPLRGSLIFAGYSPYNKDEGSQLQNVNFEVETKTLSIDGYEVEDYKSISEADMYSSKEYKNKCQTDLMYFLPKTDAFGDYVGTVSESAYTANFYHALAQVVFTVECETDIDKNYIRLREILLSNIVSKGNFSAKAERTQKRDVIWTLADGADVSTLNVLSYKGDSGGMQLQTTPLKVVELLTIPIGEHEISITYSLIVNGKPHQETMTFKDQWEAGKKYIYNLVLGIDTIQLVPKVATDWVTNE